MSKGRNAWIALAGILAGAGMVAAIDGFTDTPMLPTAPWHVHDPNRPQPRVVEPGAVPSPEPVKPPSDAVVLFDGTNFDQWVGDKGAPTWKLEDGAMTAVPGQGGIRTKQKFGDCQLHIEWRAPNPPRGQGQDRGNSGVFLLNRYEIQVLDCYQAQTYADGTTGALYGVWPPLVNACRKPGEWNTYDIIFTGPRFKENQLETPAYVTVLLNGIVLHNHQAELGPTVWRAVAKYSPQPSEDVIALQEHGHPVSFRNIWVRKLGTYDEAPKAEETK